MSKLSIANLRKTIYYLRRNGLRDTYLAALERLRKNPEDAYSYEAPDEASLAAQRALAAQWGQEKGGAGYPLFSILVPAYRTDEAYLRAMIDSVLAQSYGHFTLIIADASGHKSEEHAPGEQRGVSVERAPGEQHGVSEEHAPGEQRGVSVEQVAGEYRDERIRYLRLEENRGISGNTNAALAAAEGDYIGLLDHDDLLAPDALFEMASAIRQAGQAGITLRLLYSDEDKCDETGQYYYEPHKKLDFNLELLLANNYICHFMVLEAGLAKSLGFRREYDGAQDYDLALRSVRKIYEESEGSRAANGVNSAFSRLEAEKAIRHVPAVLYHWRCHRDSTAENPGSKQYAYEAGGRAVADFIRESGIEGRVTGTKHLGFYRVHYEPDIFSARSDVGAVGGKLLDGRGNVAAGIYDDDGVCPYRGLYKDFSGTLHRASLRQDAHAVDIRLMRLRPELLPAARAAAAAYLDAEDILRLGEDGSLCCRAAGLTEEQYRALSGAVCRAIRLAGFRIVWDPEWRKKL